MKKPILFFACLLLARTIMAQEDNNSAPFFRGDYCEAKLYTWDGHMYPGLRVKLNLQNNAIKFVKDNSDEIELTISFNVKKILFGDCGTGMQPAVFEAGFPKQNARQTEQSFYQVLDSGKVMLLKYVDMMAARGNGSAYSNSNDNSYHTRDATVWDVVNKYYLYKPGGALAEISKTNENMLSLLPDQREAVEGYITKQKLKLKREADLLQLIKFYNQL